MVDAIEQVYADRLEEQTERLAHHALRGEQWESSVRYARQAAIRGLAHSAYREAAGYFDQAISALAHMTDDRPTQERAVDLRLDLQQALIPLADFERIRTCLEEARFIAQELGDRSRLGRIDFVMTHCLWQLGEHQQALAAAQDALAHADAIGDASLEVAATYLATYLYRDLGEYRRAVDGLRRTVDILAGPLAHERFGLAGYPSVMSRALLSTCLTDLGQFPEAIESAQLAISIAETLNHPYSLAIGYQCLGETLLLRGDPQNALVAVERSLAICQQWSLAHNVPKLTLLLGHVQALAGQAEAALPLLHEVKGFVTAHTWTPNISRIGASLAESYLLIGQIGEAAHLARSALDLAMERQDRGHQARSLRVLGEIAAQQDPPDVEEAQAGNREALALAEELGMRPLEAHCHLGLGKLCRRARASRGGSRRAVYGRRHAERDGDDLLAVRRPGRARASDRQ